MNTNDNDKKNQELELRIKQLFQQDVPTRKQASKQRLLSIVKRGLHELALRDFAILAGNMIVVMMTMLTAYIKLLNK